MLSIANSNTKFLILFVLTFGMISACGNETSPDKFYNNETSKQRWCGVYAGVLSKEGRNVQLKLKIKPNGFYSLEQKELTVNSIRTIISYHWKSTSNETCICLFKADGTELSEVNFIDTSKVEIYFKRVHVKAHLFRKL